jgi:hypothetical protein
LVPDEKAAHRQVFGQAPPHKSQSWEKMEKMKQTQENMEFL